MIKHKEIWNRRWENEHKVFKNFVEYQNSMGVVVRDLLKELKKTIDNLSVFDKKVADVGGGYGAILNLLINESNERHLIEISENAIDIAKKKYGVKNVHNVDLTELEFAKTNYFDLVLCNEVFEHIFPLKIDVFVNNIYKLLKPGGKILISTPNIRSLTTFLLLIKGWNPFMFKMDKTHINPFTTKELSVLMHEHGFNKINLFTTKMLLYKTEKRYFHLPFRLNLGEHIISVWEKH